jgi:hypothetical protein
VVWFFFISGLLFRSDRLCAMGSECRRHKSPLPPN